MHIENPYPTDSERHQVSFFVGKEDWRYFQQVTGSARGLIAKLAASYFHQLVSEFRQDNLTTYEPDYHSRIANAIQRVQLRAVDGLRHFDNERRATARIS